MEAPDGSWKPRTVQISQKDAWEIWRGDGGGEGAVNCRRSHYVHASSSTGMPRFLSASLSSAISFARMVKAVIESWSRAEWLVRDHHVIMLDRRKASNIVLRKLDRQPFAARAFEIIS